MKILAIILALSLSGCGCFGDRYIDTPEAIKIEREILRVCEPIKPFDQEKDEIGFRYVELVGMYGVCSNRQDASIKTIKELANIKETK